MPPKYGLFDWLEPFDQGDEDALCPDCGNSGYVDMNSGHVPMCLEPCPRCYPAPPTIWERLLAVPPLICDADRHSELGQVQPLEHQP